MEQLPKEIGRVRVGMAGGRGADPGIRADEDADQIGREDILQLGKMRVRRRRCVLGRFAALLARRCRTTGGTIVLRALEGRAVRSTVLICDGGRLGDSSFAVLRGCDFGGRVLEPS